MHEKNRWFRLTLYISKSFHDEDRNLFTYNNGMQKNKHFVVCVKSLLMVTYLTNVELSNNICFNDEIKYFLEYLTHNENDFKEELVRRLFNNILFFLVQEE